MVGLLEKTGLALSLIAKGPEVKPVTEGAMRVINSILNGSFLNVDKYQEIC